MNITAIIYAAAARRTAYILGTVIGNCKLFPAERAPRDWSGYANVITVTAGEDGPVVTAGLQKRVTFRPKGEDETVAAAELIAKAFCPPEAPMPTDARKARIDAFLEAHNTLALATGCGKWVRCTPLEYLRVDGRLYILTEGGLKCKGIWWNGAISAAVFDSYAGMASLAGLQMTGTAVYIDPLSDEYRSVIEARGVQLQQLQQMPAMLHAVRLDLPRYELLDGALRADGYGAGAQPAGAGKVFGAHGRGKARVHCGRARHRLAAGDARVCRPVRRKLKIPPLHFCSGGIFMSRSG